MYNIHKIIQPENIISSSKVTVLQNLSSKTIAAQLTSYGTNCLWNYELAVFVIIIVIIDIGVIMEEEEEEAPGSQTAYHHVYFATLQQDQESPGHKSLQEQSVPPFSSPGKI